RREDRRRQRIRRSDRHVRDLGQDQQSRVRLRRADPDRGHSRRALREHLAGRGRQGAEGRRQDPRDPGCRRARELDRATPYGQLPDAQLGKRQGQGGSVMRRATTFYTAACAALAATIAKADTPAAPGAAPANSPHELIRKTSDQLIKVIQEGKGYYDKDPDRF